MSQIASVHTDWVFSKLWPTSSPYGRSSFNTRAKTQDTSNLHSRRHSECWCVLIYMVGLLDKDNLSLSLSLSVHERLRMRSVGRVLIYYALGHVIPSTWCETTDRHHTIDTMFAHLAPCETSLTSRAEGLSSLSLSLFSLLSSLSSLHERLRG